MTLTMVVEPGIALSPAPASCYKETVLTVAPPW